MPRSSLIPIACKRCLYVSGDMCLEDVWLTLLRSFRTDVGRRDPLPTVVAIELPAEGPVHSLVLMQRLRTAIQWMATTDWQQNPFDANKVVDIRATKEACSSPYARDCTGVVTVYKSRRASASRKFSNSMAEQETQHSTLQDNAQTSFVRPMPRQTPPPSPEQAQYAA